ncbi:uncharacterized protein LOC116948177 [Petromyzon marinus]
MAEYSSSAEPTASSPPSPSTQRTATAPDGLAFASVTPSEVATTHGVGDGSAGTTATVPTLTDLTGPPPRFSGTTELPASTAASGNSATAAPSLDVTTDAPPLGHFTASEPPPSPSAPSPSTAVAAAVEVLNYTVTSAAPPGTDDATRSELSASTVAGHVTEPVTERATERSTLVGGIVPFRDSLAESVSQTTLVPVAEVIVPASAAPPNQNLQAVPAPGHAATMATTTPASAGSVFAVTVSELLGSGPVSSSVKGPIKSSKCEVSGACTWLARACVCAPLGARMSSFHKVWPPSGTARRLPLLSIKSPIAFVVAIVVASYAL